MIGQCNPIDMVVDREVNTKMEVLAVTCQIPDPGLLFLSEDGMVKVCSLVVPCLAHLTIFHISMALL